MKLQALLIRVLGAPAGLAEPEARLEDLPGWDSIRHIELVTALEKFYGIEFSMAEILAMTSTSAIREILRRRGIEA